jgi:hypothetical protein
VQRYKIEPHTSYTGQWHVEGITEGIVGVGVYYAFIDDELDGGNLIFRNKSFPGESYDGGEKYEEEFRVGTGSCVVFSNELPHRVTKIENNSDEARTRLFIDFFVVDPKSPLNEDDDERGIKESLEVALERREKIRSELHKCQVGWGYTMYGNCGSVEFIDNKSILRNYSNCGGDYTELLSGNLSNEDN